MTDQEIETILANQDYILDEEIEKILDDFKHELKEIINGSN